MGLVIAFLLLPISAKANCGTFTSKSFDTGGISNFGSLTWEPATQSGGCQLKFQIATNDGNATWEFLGPDGSVSTYYTKTTSVWTGHNSHRYIKYQALFISDGARTPILNKVSIAYDVVSAATLEDFVFYNWPNPVFGKTTSFYYRIPEEKEIRTKIYDLSYDLVDELSGYDREGNIAWDVKNINSGVYLAQLTAGKYKKVIKVMIIK
ncbi:MAG: T9SS type A sorting domain-containing protein [Candidatus Desantisbacteria bacterium]